MLAMRYFQLALLCFICIAKSYGQTGTRHYVGLVVEITKEKRPKKIYTKVEITSPGFPNGDSSWVQSLEESLNQTIPFRNGAKPGKYMVSVRFLIERDGSLTDIVCLKDPGFGMCKQVKVAVIKKFSPRWRPQTSNN
jgi:hypothetical protein